MAQPTIRRLALEHLHQPGGWRSPAFVEIDEAGVVASVHGTEPADWAGSEVLRLSGYALPGMANLHSHAFQRALAGQGEVRAPGSEDSFWTWRKAMYALAERVGPEDVELITTQLYIELLEAGFTAVGEFHYLHHDPAGRPYADPAETSTRIVAAAERTGIALTLLPVLYRHGGFDAPPEPTQRRFVHESLAGYLELLSRMEAVARKRPWMRVGAAPHSLRAVSTDELTELVGALDPEWPIHIHAAEQEEEVHASLRHLGSRPVAWLLDHHGLGPRWCVVHATHVDASERRRLARSGTVVGLCPSTEANLGDGIFPAAAYVGDGGTFGIGSDSQVVVGVGEELRLLEYVQRLVHRRRNLLSAEGSEALRHVGRRLYDLALAGGAQALGQPMGEVVPGRRADLVVLDENHPRLVGHGPESVLDAWILGAAQGAVRDVLVGGRRLVEDGRHALAADLTPQYGRLVRELLRDR